jgi:hypothetical protein
MHAAVGTKAKLAEGLLKNARSDPASAIAPAVVNTPPTQVAMPASVT